MSPLGMTVILSKWLVADGVKGFLEVHKADVDCSTLLFRLLCYQSWCQYLLNPIFPNIVTRMYGIQSNLTCNN